MGTEKQIRDLLRGEGMAPEEISYDEVLGVYRVKLDEEDTDDRFIESSSDSDSSEVKSIDPDELEEAKSRIQYSDIPDGKVVVKDTMIGSHFRIRIS